MSLFIAAEVTMLNVYIFFTLNIILVVNAVALNPRYYPSKGEIWPKAWHENKTSATFNVDPLKLEYKVTGKDCTKIQLAVQRCKDYIDTLSNITRREYLNGQTENNEEQPARNTLKELQIFLTNDCEDLPYFGMDESYNLTVSTTSVLNGSSVWGILRGMETFSQLFYLTSGFKKILINRTDIVDRPNYPHRGLLLNTGSHYLSIQNILKIIDAMGMNKLNILHWRIVDDESFPYQSTKFPELSRDGAFHSSMVYTKSDIEKIKDHAKNLGIRIMVEFDMPGHSYSIGLSHPEILTSCPFRNAYAPPLNPIKNETYSFLKELFREVQEMFPDTHIHLGGDEVETKCWERDRFSSNYMQKNNLTNNELLALFYKNAFALLKQGTVPVVWDDVFAANVPLPKNAIVQTWDINTQAFIANVLSAGFRGIQSAPFFLNELNHDVDWLYAQDPRMAIQGVLDNNALLQNLVGSTICMWGEMVDDTNVLSRTWPRASAVAEVLWSETKGTGLDESTIKRIEEHTCRMRRRGIPASPPIGPGFCLL